MVRLPAAPHELLTLIFISSHLKFHVFRMSTWQEQETILIRTPGTFHELLKAKSQTRCLLTMTHSYCEQDHLISSSSLPQPASERKVGVQRSVKAR